MIILQSKRSPIPLYAGLFCVLAFSLDLVTLIKTHGFHPMLLPLIVPFVLIPVGCFLLTRFLMLIPEIKSVEEVNGHVIFTFYSKKQMSFDFKDVSSCVITSQSLNITIQGKDHAFLVVDEADQLKMYVKSKTEQVVFYDIRLYYGAIGCAIAPLWFASKISVSTELVPGVPLKFVIMGISGIVSGFLIFKLQKQTARIPDTGVAKNMSYVRFALVLGCLFLSYFFSHPGKRNFKPQTTNTDSQSLERSPSSDP